MRQRNYAIFLFIFFIGGISTTLFGQTIKNVGLDATASQYPVPTSWAAKFGPSNYNDDSIPDPANTPYGMLSAQNSSDTFAWIQFDWKDTVKVNRLHFYNLQDFANCMIGAEVWWWDGSDWQVVGSFLKEQGLEVVYDFPLVATTRLRITKFRIGGINNANPKWREIQALHVSYGNNDLHVESIDSLQTFCGGKHPVWARIYNVGTNQIDTLTVNWELDGIKQGATNYYGLIDTAGGKGSHYVQLNLGTISFDETRRIKVWTSSPNNGKDPNTGNDTLDVVRKKRMQGKYIVGKKGDFKTPGVAAQELAEAGICGPVEIVIRPGHYKGFTLPEIIGSSATNTISFIAASPDSVKLSGSGQSTLILEGADYTIFKNIHFYSDSVYHACAALLTANADYNTFSNCVFEVDSSWFWADGLCIAHAPFSTSFSANTYSGNFNKFVGNRFIGGRYAIYVLGGFPKLVDGNYFLNNTILSPRSVGAYFRWTEGSVFEQNFISNTVTGLYVSGSSGYSFQRNTLLDIIHVNRFWSTLASYNGTPFRSIIANNVFAGSHSAFALEIASLKNVAIVNNSFYGEGTGLIQGAGLDSIDLRNNIFHHSGSAKDVLLTINDQPDFTAFDYNNFYTSAGYVAKIGGNLYKDTKAFQSWHSDFNQNNSDLNPKWISVDTNHQFTKSSPRLTGPNPGLEIDRDSMARCGFLTSMGPYAKTPINALGNSYFLAPDTAWLGCRTTVLNAAKPTPAEGTNWYLNNQWVSDGHHLDYYPLRTGFDTIKLVRENCLYKDSITDYVHVHKPLRKPAVEFNTNKNGVYLNEEIALVSLVENGASEWNWSIRPASRFNPDLGYWEKTYSISDSSSPNPTISFLIPGLYDVQLRARNAIGEDSLLKTKLITARRSIWFCSSVNKATESRGVIYDDGGPNGVYSKDLQSVKKCDLLISSCQGEVDLFISQFNLAKDDYLRIYDGSYSTGKPLWDIVNYPNGISGRLGDAGVPDSITAVSGTVYFEFETGTQPGSANGFTIEWIYRNVTWKKPTADFVIPDTACIGVPVLFKSTSTGLYDALEWDIDNDSITDRVDTSFITTYPKPGTYNIKLKVFSFCTQHDSVIKKLVVVKASRAPKPEFSTNRLKVWRGDTITLNDLSTYCSNYTQWRLGPSGQRYDFVNGSLSTDNITDVELADTGYYDVKLIKGNDHSKDSLTKLNYIHVFEYCRPYITLFDADVGVSRVKFGSIDKTSSVGKYSYSDFKYLTTRVERGLSYPIVIERSSYTKDITRAVWIDWNIDGDFDDAGELVSIEKVSKNPRWIDTIKVPVNATPGKTGMRVAAVYNNSSPEPCERFTLAEFEDYGINISPHDKTPPQLKLLGPLEDTMVVFSNWTEPGYIATDLLDGNITSKVLVDYAYNANRVSMNTISYEVSDIAGNKAYARRILHVIDTTAPVISLLGPDTIYHGLHGAFVDPGVTVTDNYYKRVDTTVTGVVNTDKAGTYIKNYCATDSSGNGPICISRVIIVGDRTAPVLTLLGNLIDTVEQCYPYKDPGFLLFDDADSSNVNLTYGGNWDGTEKRGTYSKEYIATDPYGNRSVVVRTIIVRDTRSPALTLRGNLVVEVPRWSVYKDAGVDKSDDCNDTSEITITRGGSFDDTQFEGVFTLTYTGVDASGNASQPIQRLIQVTMGLDEIDQPHLDIYPNPSSGEVLLKSNIELEKVLISIVDLSGRKVLTFNGITLTNGTAAQLDLSALAPGSYQVHIASSNFGLIDQLIIEH